MLKDNIKILRKENGLSQEELASKLHVVRQTVSKWEQGLSVPDSEMLILISEVLDVPVSTLLGENIEIEKEDNLKEISNKLETINLELYKRKNQKRKIIHWTLIILCLIIVVILIVLFLLDSPYLKWDYAKIETSVMGTIFHMVEWIFIRVAPIALIILIGGIILTRQKK